MFLSVKNEGGTSPCQEDQGTFKIMRSSQFQVFSLDILKSYLDDLIEIKKQNRNIMTEKYARMMEFTSPEQYKLFKTRLPEINSKSKKYIEDIIECFLKWEKDFHNKYSYLSSMVRPIISKEDSSHITSFETYLRGELSTYSSKTIKFYRDYVLTMFYKKINLSMKIQENIVKQYGFNSLMEANEFIKKRTSFS